MPTWVEEMKLPDVPTTSEKHNFCESLTSKTIVKTENTDTDQMINQITEAFPFRNNPETDELATDFSQEEKECRPKLLLQLKLQFVENFFRTPFLITSRQMSNFCSRSLMFPTQILMKKN